MGASSTRRSRRGVRVPVLVVLLLCGCAASGTNGAGVSSRASGVSTEDLSGGRLDALTSGRLFLRVIRFGQPPHSKFGSKKHQPGFIYQVSGQQVLALTGGPQVTLTSGEAYFHLSVPHTHLNPGPDPNSWLFLALWPSAARGQPNVNPLAYISYDSPDFTPASAAGPFSESLQLVSMEARGHTATTERSGVQLLYVLSGAATVHAGTRTTTLGPEAGIYLRPHVKAQVIAYGAATSYLDLTVTPVGEPFEVRSPA